MVNQQRGQIEQFLINRDMYGHVIGVNYRGSGTYQTRLGSLCTLATYILMLISFGELLIAYNDGSKQEEKSQTVYKDRYISDAYNLNE